MDIKLSDLKSIPNLLSLLRIALIPLIVKFYLESKILYAGIVIIFSGLTDLLDGYIARKFHQITDLGKILDPVADKLTQLAIISLMVHRSPLIPYLLVMFVTKEFTMLAVTMYLHKHGEKYEGAQIYGKISTFTFYACMVFLFVSPDISKEKANVLIIVTGAALLFSWVMYFRGYWQSYQRIKEKKSKES